MRMREYLVPAGAVALALSQGGCGPALTQSAPHPDRPEIVSGSLEPARVPSGCPVRLRLIFRDVEENITHAHAFWSYEGMGEGTRPGRILQDGYAAVALDPAAVKGRRAGEATIAITPLQPGQYRYSVQIEDAAGHRSNVLGQSFSVLAVPAGASVSCAEPVR